MPHAFTLTYADGRPPQPLFVPAGWHEVSTEQFLHLVAGADEDTPTLCVLTGLTEHTLGQVAAVDALYLENALAFAQDLSELQALVPNPNLPEVGQSSYGKLLLAQQYIGATQPEQRPGFGVAAYLLALYGLPDEAEEATIAAAHRAILAQPITKTYADLVFIWGRWQACISATPATRPITSSPKTKKNRRGWRGFSPALPRC